jgi:cell division protein FtsB
MEEIKNDPKKSKRAWSTVFFILIVVYLAFILSRSLWQNYKVNQEIKSLEQEVTTLEEENQRLKNLVLYYRTDSYKEKEARRKLLMKMPDEKVLALPETEYNHEQAEDQIDNEKDRDKYQEPNYKLWIEYIFG